MNYPSSYPSSYPASLPYAVADPGVYLPDVGSLIDVLTRSMNTLDTPPWLYEENYNAYVLVAGNGGGFWPPAQYAQQFAARNQQFAPVTAASNPNDSVAIGNVVDILDRASRTLDIPAFQYADAYNEYVRIAGNGGGFPTPEQYEAALVQLYNPTATATAPTPATGKGIGIVAALAAALALFRK